jgi:hypothetical protein
MKKLPPPRLVPYEYAAERSRAGTFLWAGHRAMLRRFQNSEERDLWIEKKKRSTQELLTWSLVFWPKYHLWIRAAAAFAVQSNPWRSRDATKPRLKLSPTTTNFLRTVTMEVDSTGWQIWPGAFETTSSEVKNELFTKALAVQYDPFTKHKSSVFLHRKPQNQKYLLTTKGVTTVSNLRGLPKSFRPRTDSSIQTMIAQISEAIGEHPL